MTGRRLKINGWGRFALYVGLLAFAAAFVERLLGVGDATELTALSGVLLAMAALNQEPPS